MVIKEDCKKRDDNETAAGNFQGKAETLKMN